MNRKLCVVALVYVFILAIWGILGRERGGHRQTLREIQPFRTVIEWIDPSPPRPPSPRTDICFLVIYDFPGYRIFNGGCHVHCFATNGGTSLPDWMGTSVLDTINSIASPCPASWDAMEEQRFVASGQCRQNVYDFSQMTRAQAEALIVEERRTPLRPLLRRTDGRW